MQVYISSTVVPLPSQQNLFYAGFDVNDVARLQTFSKVSKASTLQIVMVNFRGQLRVEEDLPRAAAASVDQAQPAVCEPAD